MNIFEEVKAAVDINTAAEYYGLNVRKDTALCPFHNEKTGSLKTLSSSRANCSGYRQLTVQNGLRLISMSLFTMISSRKDRLATRLPLKG